MTTLSKYYRDLDMSLINDSCNMLLEMVKAKSSVLEFGPADGIMTEYMCQTKECEIFIVELDPNSYESAVKFARGGYCGDIESYEWEAKIGDQKFDYIMFADVLEHLIDPKATLQRVRKYLKPGGRLLLSVPNIAHNAILINLLNNEFEYQTTGLLDNTHLRHFTYKSLLRMLDETMYTTITQRATTLQPNHTGIRVTYEDVSPCAQKVLQEKPFGTVFQFIFECVDSVYYHMHKEDFLFISDIKDLKHIDFFYIHLEQNGKFDAYNRIDTALEYGSNRISVDLSDYKPAKVRLGFGSKPCVVTIQSIRMNSENLNASDLESNWRAKIGEVFLFDCNDPYWICDLGKETISTIEVCFHYELLEYKDWFTAASDSLATAQKRLEGVQSSIDQLTAERDSIRQERDSIRQERDSIRQERDLCIAEGQKLKQQVGQSEEALDSVLNSNSWKITKPLRKISARMRVAR